ncbi:unnamed protein product [Brachionus calyciflorus]|uniref:Elongator complex protein 2 n=1 Tax=Brachionus calyciflorus TaxID=104777 RepID=A0A813M4S1_9BILA|nr:unnamed protein product [Brachionus calyciflorus]
MTIKPNKVESVYISAGCNRCPKALDWGGRQNQLIYAQSRSVALLNDKEPFEIKCTFNKHTDRVNAVKWITSNDFVQNELLSTNEFVSVSKDKSVIVWQGADYEYEPYQILNGHTNSISIADAFYFDESNKVLTTFIASASVDSTVRIWKRRSENYDIKNSNFTQDQVITSKMNGFALALKFYLLPISNLPLLLIGFENHKIEIHVRLHNESDDTYKFFCLHTLIGHEDWIRDIDVCQPTANQLLIASSSQDNYIRLWKLDSNILTKIEDVQTKLIIEGNSVEKETQLNNEQKEEEEDDEEEVTKKKSEVMEEELKLKSSLFTIHSKKLDNYVQYSINLESVLFGHEDWIYTVKFHPKMSYGQPLTLISASMDKTLVVWTYNEENSVWIDVARAGDIGGNTLGFYGATFDPTANYIIAHGYQGALHLWKRNLDDASKGEYLTPGVINSGHFDLVEDICWEPEQNYFLSVSKDQTTRFHGNWRHDNCSTWHELGRPQIHGYDLQCVAFIDRFKFVSGADEKLLRIFESPKIFLKNYYNLSQDQSVINLLDDSNIMPQGASVPALGLSNKAVFDEEKKVESEDKKPSLADELYKEVYFNRVDLKKPPTEEHLLQNTLWPETQKLYGHGYEIFSVAVDPNTKLIASACKASKPEHAGIILWQEQMINNQTSFKQYATLNGHELTIVQMKFSNNGNYLLSVSRDRSWKLFERKNENNFELKNGINSKNPYHTRIIWSCDWSHDDKYFVTTSRDKRACVWLCESTENRPVGSHLEMNDSITACAFAPAFCTDNKSYLIAFGLESGNIEFYKWDPQNGFSKYLNIENRFSHHMTVKRLSFRKIYQEKNSEKEFCLASCSEDSSTRLYTISA